MNVIRASYNILNVFQGVFICILNALYSFISDICVLSHKHTLIITVFRVNIIINLGIYIIFVKKKQTNFIELNV